MSIDVASKTEHASLIKQGSPLEVIRDKGYWSDRTIISDLTGWREARPWLQLWLPFRRHLLVDWYQPIVRIGKTGFSRVSMIEDKAPNEDVAETGKSPDGNQYQCKEDQTGCKHEIEFKLEALSDGELYIYLNDGVFIHPKLVKFFYKNNNSSADVTISEVGASGKD